MSGHDEKRAEVDAMLAGGPMRDIFRADEARALVEIIGTHATAVDASTFAATFATLQAYAINMFILAITRVFDKPNQNYTLRSLPAIVEHVLANTESRPVREPALLAHAFQHLGSPIKGLGADSTTTKLAMGALHASMPSPKTHPALAALKTLRDKQLAHAEHIKIESIPKTGWGPADELLRIAQLMIAALGSLTGVMHIDGDGNYFLKSNAQRAPVSTHRLLRKLGIAPPLPHEMQHKAQP
jgi:hypothetical protein